MPIHDFFTSKLPIGKRQNHISFFKNNEGKWIDNQQDILDHTLAHFITIFTTNREVTSWSSIKQSPSSFENINLLELDKQLLVSEINSAIHSFKPFKSLGPDGLHLFFYQKY